MTKLQDISLLINYRNREQYPHIEYDLNMRNDSMQDIFLPFIGNINDDKKRQEYEDAMASIDSTLFLSNRIEGLIIFRF